MKPKVAVIMSEAACRQIVRARSAGMCEICGLARADTMHHRQKRSQRGGWHPANILHLCGDGTRGCHGRITNTRTSYYDAGWLCRSTWNPLEVKVNLAYGTVILDDRGGYRPADQPPPAEFTTVEVDTPAGPVHVMAETTECEHLMVAPILGDPDSRGGFTGGWHIVHASTGAHFPAAGMPPRWVRRMAALLIESGLDWSRFPTIPDARVRYAEVISGALRTAHAEWTADGAGADDGWELNVGEGVTE